MQAKIADVATGMSGSLRGIANLAEKGYKKVTGQSDESLTSLITGEKPAPLGERGLAEGSRLREGTGAKLVDRCWTRCRMWWAVPLASSHPSPRSEAGRGLPQEAQAVGKNADWSGATAGGIIGGLSDEGTAAEGALIGGVLSGGLPAVGAPRPGYNTAKSAIAPATEAGRTAFGQKYFAEVLGPARGKWSPPHSPAPTKLSPAVRRPPQTASLRPTSGRRTSSAPHWSARRTYSPLQLSRASRTLPRVLQRGKRRRGQQLGTVAQTPADLAAVVAGRKAAFTVNYPQAFGQHIGIDDELMAMSENP